MEDLPLGRIAAFVPEFAVKDLPLGITLMMIHCDKTYGNQSIQGWLSKVDFILVSYDYQKSFAIMPQLNCNLSTKLNFSITVN